MSNKVNSKEQKTSANIGDIATIKDILFGQDIQSLEQRLNELEAKLGNAQGENTESLTSLRRHADEEIKAIKEHFAEKIANVEKRMNQNVKDLEKQILSVSKSDKQSLAEMLQQLSTSLIKGDK